MRWKACNSTLVAVCSLLQKLAAALSGNHEFRIMLLSAQLLGAFSLVSGAFWVRLPMTLTAVCAVLLSRTFVRDKSDFDAR